MPRAGHTHTLVADTPAAQQQLNVNTEQTLVLEKDCVAVLLGARGTGAVNVTFDNSVASSVNGLPIACGSAPIFIPLGRLCNSAQALRAFGTGNFLDVVQLA